MVSTLDVVNQSAPSHCLCKASFFWCFLVLNRRRWDAKWQVCEKIAVGWTVGDQRWNAKQGCFWNEWINAMLAWWCLVTSVLGQLLKNARQVRFNLWYFTAKLEYVGCMVWWLQLGCSYWGVGCSSWQTMCLVFFCHQPGQVHRDFGHETGRCNNVISVKMISVFWWILARNLLWQ